MVSYVTQRAPYLQSLLAVAEAAIQQSRDVFLILDKQGYESHLAMNGQLRGGMGDVEAVEPVGVGSTAS